MISRTYKRKIIATEDFRLFDDLHPVVQKAVRECSYLIKLNEIMSQQHAYYAQGRPLEELAEDIRRRDKTVFDQRMKLPPNLRYPEKDPFG